MLSPGNNLMIKDQKCKLSLRGYSTSARLP